MKSSTVKPKSKPVKELNPGGQGDVRGLPHFYTDHGTPLPTHWDDPRSRGGGIASKQGGRRPQQPKSRTGQRTILTGRR
jgi:hypothetical protein